jgi:hypothetical protein
VKKKGTEEKKNALTTALSAFKKLENLDNVKKEGG